MSKLLVDEISDADNTGPVTVTDGAVVNRTGDGTIIDLQVGGTTLGSIGAQSGKLQINGSSGTGFFLDTVQILPKVNGALADNQADLGSNGYRFKDLYLSGGVYLGGTGAANHLDDYEEGTWDIKLTGVNTGQTGSYTKVGNVVTIHADFTATATANGTTIGLPFTANTGHGALVIGWLSATAAKSVYVNANTASGISTVAGGSNGSALTNGERMIIGGSYISNT